MLEMGQLHLLYNIAQKLGPKVESTINTCSFPIGIDTMHVQARELLM